MLIENSLFPKLAVTTAGVAGTGFILWNIYKRYQKPQIPQHWEQVGTIEELLAYPIKSCQWVQLDEAEVTYMGLRNGWLRDRTFMVIDKNSNFISARAYPEMLRVKTSFEGPLVTLSHPDIEPVTFDLQEIVRNPKFKAHVWSTPVTVHGCGWEPSEWFSRLLQKEADSLRLVFYSANNCRQLRLGTNPIFRFRDTDTGALPDETSYNLINKASVEDLNARIGEGTVQTKQFRPNFILAGAKPLAEDDWRFVRIGDHVFEVIKPTSRCVMTTINPNNALKDPKGEPLATLKKYRQLSDPAMRRSAGSSPSMGLQLALRSQPGGRVRVGDIVYAQAPERHHQH